jgi:hypothetical protein
MESAKTNPFANLGMQECMLLYPALLQNAYRHLEVAQVIADIEEYGIANSHLVISAGEYIKGLSVYLQGFGLPVEEIRKLARFFDEQEGGFYVSPGVILLGNFAKALFHVFDGLAHSIMRLNFSEFRQSLDQHLRPVQLLTQANHYSKWWSRAKELEHRGFWVDYEIELHTPREIGLSDYELSLEIVLELRENCLSTIEFIKAIPEKRRKEFLKWIKNSYEPFLTRLNKWPFSVFT